MSSPKRPLAVFTIAQFEPIWLPTWCHHYGRHVPSTDIFVLHHPLPAGLQHTAKLEFDGWESGTYFGDVGDPITYDMWEDQIIPSTYATVVEVHRDESFSHEWLRDTVRTFFAFLLQSYDHVLFAESDEFWVPLAGNLADYAAGLSGPGVRATGYEVIQQPRESPLMFNLDASLVQPMLHLDQRAKWAPSEIYSKTTLASIPLDWDIGFHHPRGACASQISPEKADDLFLLHLHKADFNLAFAKSSESARRKWAKEDFDKEWGIQNRLDTQEAVQRYFDTSIDDQRSPAVLEDIRRDVIEAFTRGPA